jgi:hypothetical protein
MVSIQNLFGELDDIEMASIYLNSIKQEKMFNGVEIASLESLTYQ